MTTTADRPLSALREALIEDEPPLASIATHSPFIFLPDASPRRALHLLNKTSAFEDLAYLSLHKRFVRAGDTRARPSDLRCP